MAISVHLNPNPSSSLPSHLPWRSSTLTLSPFPSSAATSNRPTNFPISKPFSLKPTSHLSLSPSSIPNPNPKPKTRPEPVPLWVNPNSPRASQLRRNTYDAMYRSLLTLSESLNTCNPTIEDVSRVLTGLGDTILEQDAVIILNNMKNPRTALIALQYLLDKVNCSRRVILYNVTLKVLRKCRELGSAEKVFDEMLERGVKPDNVTFATLITCSRFCSEFEKAVGWYERMAEFGCEADGVTCSAMIDVYGRAGEARKAVGLYERARRERWKMDVVAYSAIVRILGKSGDFEGCLRVYEEMKARGVRPNMAVYNTLLEAMGKARRPWQAKNVYQDMIESGVEPTLWSYAALLRGLCKARYGEDAMKVYREMKEKGFEFNVVTYNSMLAMCADIGFSDEASEIFQDMKSSRACKPDLWTFSSMVTVYSCNGKVDEAEAVVNEMQQAGFQPNIFILTSLVQCYGKADRTDDVVRTFNQSFELGIALDDRFCGSLLNVMTQTPVEELSKLIDCVARANESLGYVVKMLVEENSDPAVFRDVSMQLFKTVAPEVKKPYCNCLIDLCINLNLLARACELLDMSLMLGIYSNIQSRSPTQWSLHLKTLSHGAALTALHIWMNDLTRALESGEDLPPVLGINTGHGKHKYSEKGLAGVIESHLKKLDSPFHESSEEAGWFMTTNSAAATWLECRRMEELMSS